MSVLVWIGYALLGLGVLAGLGFCFVLLYLIGKQTGENMRAERELRIKEFELRRLKRERT